MQVIGATVLFAGLTAAGLALRKRHPFVLVGWLWFVGILVPVSSAFQVGSQAYADRFAYIPQLGLFVAGVWATCMLPRPVVRWLPHVGAAIIVLLGVCTVRQVGRWTDTVTLFEYTLRVAPANVQVLAIAGMGRARRGEYPEAIAHFREARRLVPRNAEIHLRLGDALAHAGQTAEALDQLRAAVALDPSDTIARRDLVAVLANCGRIDEAAKLIPR